MRAYWAFALGLLTLAGCPAGFPDVCDNGACDDASVGDAGIDAPPGCDLSKDPKDSPACVDSTVGVFVDSTKSDTNDGSKAKPVATIGKALSLAKQKGLPRL